ncbi:focadhesin isoform X1 [Parasteatoda tepidariorum]|uniref:focadhesin isoform X1 n=1 Tax=Parasteatoda tepidariorum TaxID=114398 RepID=UPI001C71C35F|nr:focadhesin isoform X1 [Parasteatoda tepidariorum]
MEDFKQRLKYDDIAIRTRCVQKLVQIVKKKTKGELVTASSKQIPELNLLWESCLCDSPSTADFVIQGLVYLVVNKVIDVSYAVNKFLGSISSTGNAPALVKGISKILIHQHKKKQDNTLTSLYSLHHPKHPLITVLQNNEDYLPLILKNIADAVAQENIVGLKAMEPVIDYLLYNPSQKNNYSKVLTLEALIDIIKEEPKAAFYVLRFIPYLQIETYEHVSEASMFTLKARQAFYSSNFSENDKYYISELFLLASLSLSERCLVLGHDPSRLLELACNLSSSLIQISQMSSFVNVYLIMISFALKSATTLHMEKLVSIAITLLDLQPISPTVASFLAFQIIQLLPEPSIVSFNEGAKSNLSQLLDKLETYFLNHQTAESLQEKEDLLDGDNKEKRNNIFLNTFTFCATTSFQCVDFANKLDKCDWNSKMNWMKAVNTYVKDCSSSENLEVVFGIVSALFLSCPDRVEYLSSCLDTFEFILSKNNYLSTRIFSLLLYKQNLLGLPESKFLILTFLPKSATHKYAIPPVISILSSMSNEPELKAISIHLMLELWKKHDRVFSYLHKRLLESNKSISKDLNISEVVISQAAAIREICLIAPEKHGSDFLGILSKIFNESNDDTSSPAACLALDGVINLCKTEIIDLRSTWKLLGPRLSKDKRIPVICKMFELLSLIPELQVSSPEFDTFMKDIVSKIWKQIASGVLPPDAESVAYKTLAKFSIDCHELKQLPTAAKVNLALPASMKATPFDMSKSPEDVLTYIPGYAFIDLMKSIDCEIVLEGYSDFLSSVIQQEVSALPRSVYSQRKHLQKNQNTNEILMKVPKFLCTLFEARKSPALQKNIALGVLLCYVPPIEFSKDGEPMKRSIAGQSRLYEQVLSILLNEVNIDATEWQRSILLPGAWGSFMERAFFASEEARKTELELQRNLGHITVTTEEFNFQCKTAWLWVRDRILNLIKTCVKNAPTSHANAIYAIAGLVRALIKYHSSLDDASKTLCDELENFSKHDIFIAECAETILCAMKNDYQPKGKVHSWLLTHLSRPNSSSGYLIKGCSCASLCHLCPVLIHHYNNDLSSLIQDLIDNLTHNSPVLNFYSGLGLGMLVKALCDVGFPDSGEKQSQLLLITTKRLFNLYSNEETSSVSILLSLTLSIAALSQVSSEDYKDWISTTCNIFHEKLMEEEVSSMSYESLSICVSAMMIAAADGSCMNVESIESLAKWFEDKQADLPQCSGTSVALGILIEALERFGCSLGQNLKEKLQKDWFNTLSSEKKQTLHRIAALNGLCALYSCGRGLLLAKSKISNVNNMMNDLISLMFQLLNATRDTGLQTVCSWEVGRLFSVHSFNQESEESVPSSYHYLNEKSTLRFLMKTIIDNASDEEHVSECHQLTCLRSLKKEFSRPLPPLNWMLVLSPLLVNKEDHAIVETVLSVLIYQSKSSAHAANLLASYCSPPLIHSLHGNCWKILLESIPDLITALPDAKLQIFFPAIIFYVTKHDENFESDGKLLMQGIAESFKVKNLKQQSIKILQNAFVSVFKHLKKNFSLLCEHISWICSVLLCLPAKHLENSLCVTKNNSDIVPLTFIWCYLVRCGKKPLSSLRPCIEEGKHASLRDKEYIYSAVCNCFLSGICNEESEINVPEKCISWLMETIGWVNVLNEAKSQFQLLTVGEVFRFLNDVCVATIIGCSGLECCYSLLPVSNLTHHQLIENLPIAITKLCGKEKWLSVVDKLIDWFMMLLQSQHMDENDKHYIKLSLCSMRSLKEFQKNEVWTNVINNIY